jgi:T5SS/PEP-CTERM-associated repeat protein
VTLQMRHYGLGAIVVGLFAIIAPAHAQTFSTGANFTTMTRQLTQTIAGAPWEPPDTMGAAGPNHFVSFVNGSFSIFGKNGSLVSQVSDTSFWTTALGSDPGGLSDPRILYDPASQRWFATMITTDQATNNKILFARSNTADPTHGFKAVSFTTTNNRFADFPTLGLDANGVYVGTNNFNSAGTSLRSVGLYSVPKADLLATTPTLSRLTSFSALSTNTYGFTFQPVVNDGSKLPTDPTPVVSTSNNSFGVYKFTKITGTTNAGATLGSSTSVNVQSTSNPTNSPQPGTSTTIDNGDDRFSGNVVQVGNFLYAIHNITVNGRSALRWTIADATSFNIVEQGTISDSSLSYFYPSIAVNPIGDVVVGFSGSNSSTYAGTYAVVGTSAGGVAGGSLTFGAPVQTKAGTDLYSATRWGDYSAVTPDPADPGIFWAHQEYAANRYSLSGTTYGNWATQATEVVPTKAGERRWSNTAGGSFAMGGNYFGGAAPIATDHVIFSRPSASYSVTFSGSNTSNRASVRQGDVNWNLAGGSYTLTNSGVSTPSLVVGEFQGTASLSLSDGALNTVNATIGGTAVGSGALNVNAGATWTNSNSVTVGATGAGTLTVQNLGTSYVGANLAIGGSGTVNLNGGTIRFDGYSRAPGGTLNFTSGTVQVAGDRTVDTDAAIKDWFGTAPTIGVGKKLVVEGNASIATTAPVTLAGGTVAANSFLISNGGHLVSTQTSQVIGPVAALIGSLIDATGGDLMIGDATRADGFYTNGTVSVGSHTVTLADSDGAVVDAAATVTLGAVGNPGTVSAASGLTLNSGGALAGYGTVDTPNSAATPFSNNGNINGNSLAEPLTLPGYVKGTGTLDNVALTGTFSPGVGPASLNLGSVQYGGTLDIEIGGTMPGSDYDQLNHVVGAGLAQLGGTLDVSLLNGFMPQAGDMFDILTGAGGISGTFATTMLPALTGDLFWTINYGPSLVELAVEAPTPVLPGDFNSDGVVDAADYVVWRKGLDTTYTLADYDVWRAHFGETTGSNTASSLRTGASVPEPGTLLLALILAGHVCRCRRNRSDRSWHLM